MRANDVIFILLLSATCVSSQQKPFDQMTAQEHRQAAAREHQRADDAFARVNGDNIAPPETFYPYAESTGAYPYDGYLYEVGDPETYTAWPRVSDPSEEDEDAASEHREKALEHERAAAALEGLPSPQPLPPDRT